MARTASTSWFSTRIALAAATLIAGGALAASVAFSAPCTALADDAEAYGQTAAEEVLYDMSEEEANQGGEIAVSFDADGGSGTMEDQYTTLVAGVFQAPECEFTAPSDDLEFKGWSLETSDDGSAVLYQPGDMIEDFNDDFTLYATWGAKQVAPQQDDTTDEAAQNDTQGEIVVSFDANGGIGTMADQYTTLVSGVFTVPACEFKPVTDDLEFIGWEASNSSDTTGTLLQPGTQYTDFNDSFTLKALWGPKDGDVVVSFDANGGTGSMDNQTTTLVAGVFKLPECGFVAPAGKQFMGWSLEKDGSGKLYQAGAMFEDFNDSFTLYAIWGTEAKANALAKTGDLTDYAPVAAAAGVGAVLVGAAAAAFRKAFKK